MVNTPSEKASPALSAAPEAPGAPMRVIQPSVINVDMSAFLDGIGQISETITDKPASDWSGTTGQGGTAGVGDQSQTGMSLRDQAIANLPIPAVMQKKLELHIHEEVKKLRKQAQSIAATSRPGGAYKLNQLYARIRHLNAILSSLFEASVEVVKRLFVRVFIDKQTIQ